MNGFSPESLFQSEFFSPFAFRFLNCPEFVVGAVEGSIEATLLRVEAECL